MCQPDILPDLAGDVYMKQFPSIPNTWPITTAIYIICVSNKMHGLYNNNYSIIIIYAQYHIIVDMVEYYIILYI